MSEHFEGERYDDVEFIENSDPRCPVVLVLDCSHSMLEKRPGEDKSPMEALQGGLDVLVSELNNDDLARRRCEISFITYGTDVNPPTPFATADNLVVPQLEGMGTTSTGSAMLAALDAIQERKNEYRNNGIEFYRPWIMLISDGLPTDNIDEAVKRCTEAEQNKSVAIFPIGVEGAYMEALDKFSARGAKKLNGIQFNELFVWLSASQKAVSASQVGDQVAIPAPASWTEV